MGNSRILKFRAWDKHEGCWVGGFCLHSSGAFADLWVPSEKEPQWWKDSARDSRIVIQQFTGLKDKNGVEIYEGDLLMETDEPKIYWKPRLVRYKSNVAMFTVTEIHKLHDEMSWSPVAGSLDGQLKGTEVIGNIYEHPHLLTSHNPTGTKGGK